MCEYILRYINNPGQIAKLLFLYYLSGAMISDKTQTVLLI